MRDPHSLTKHAVVTLYESVYLAPQKRNSLVKIAVRCPGLVRTNISSAERNRPAEPQHEPVAMIPERPNDAAGAAMREGQTVFRAGQARWLPLFFCKCSFQRVLSPMFWKCSFQRVYRRVSGSADSKRLNDRDGTGGFSMLSESAPSFDYNPHLANSRQHVMTLVFSFPRQVFGPAGRTNQDLEITLRAHCPLTVWGVQA
jgi:hypothetical protein